jgi:hypothetical protein
VASQEFQNICITAQTFSQLPSDIAKRLLDHEIPSCVTERDWYAFDVAAAAYFHELQLVASQKDPPPASPSPIRSIARIPNQSSPVVQESGDLLIIRGTEIPPWER